ncbi:MAG: amidase domain-containing protein [Clostridia bacterium]|nr:amidase domain-containing protein [Clostridia bacterium]
MTLTVYDRESAVAYAKRWALGRNPQYFDFTEIGGDCINFVSQCIYAGAKVMNFTPIFGWFYRSASDRTASWTGVEFLYDFLMNNQGVGPFARIVGRDELMPGDVIQLGDNNRFYHSLFVTQTSPAILVAAHTNDALDRPLTSYDYVFSRFLHVEGVRK